MVLEVLRADESLQIDEILELLETQLTLPRCLPRFSSWKWRPVRQLPGKNYVRTM